MIKFEKQILFWVDSSKDDLDTSRILFNNDKFKESLFFAHLAIEKILKAIFIKRKNELAPKTHKLFYLLQQSNIALSSDYEELFGILTTFQLEGRYPDYNPKLPNKLQIQEYLKLTNEAHLWLHNQL